MIEEIRGTQPCPNRYFTENVWPVGLSTNFQIKYEVETPKRWLPSVQQSGCLVCLRDHEKFGVLTFSFPPVHKKGTKENGNKMWLYNKYLKVDDQRLTVSRRDRSIYYQFIISYFRVHAIILCAHCFHSLTTSLLAQFCDVWKWKISNH